jgi:hypothetical protein
MLQTIVIIKLQNNIELNVKNEDAVMNLLLFQLDIRFIINYTYLNI